MHPVHPCQVVDVRNYGFMAGVEVAAIKDWPTKRALDIFDRCFQKGVMVNETCPSFIHSLVE